MSPIKRIFSNQSHYFPDILCISSTRNDISYTYILTQISFSNKQRYDLNVPTYTTSLPSQQGDVTTYKNSLLNQATLLPTRTKLWLWFLSWQYVDSGPVVSFVTAAARSKDGYPNNFKPHTNQQYEEVWNGGVSWTIRRKRTGKWNISTNFLDRDVI